jgi:NAD(P)-dependent dehydrogenase (short-subunit alcohol dehydrogenase family)
VQIRDAVATVPGGPAGIGRATTIPRARADLIVAGVDAEEADDTVSQIRVAGRQGRCVHTDVGSGGVDLARPI